MSLDLDFDGTCINIWLLTVPADSQQVNHLYVRVFNANILDHLFSFVVDGGNSAQESSFVLRNLGL